MTACTSPGLCAFAGCRRPGACHTQAVRDALAGPHLVERARDAGVFEPVLQLTEDQLVSLGDGGGPVMPEVVRSAPVPNAPELRVMRVPGVGATGGGYIVGVAGGAPFAVAATPDTLGAIVATWARGAL